MIRRLTTLALTASLALPACGDDAPEVTGPAWKTDAPRLLVLGFDGMDPKLLRRFVAEGRMPNHKKLMDTGGFIPLATSNPPQSPVAWSHFITGHHSDHHGIYDFVHRDAAEMSYYLSTSKAVGPGRTIEVGDYVVPLEEGRFELLREGLSFWERLDTHGVPATVFKVPANFPPDENWRSKTMSGMGTPDMLGSYGTFQLFTDDPEWLKKKSVPSGELRTLDFAGKHQVTVDFPGPPDPFRKDGKPLAFDITIARDPVEQVAFARLGDEELILKQGEWSEWVPVSFETLPLVGEVPAMVKLYLDQAHPHLRLYASPINADPFEPALPISSPRSFAPEVAEISGRFYTQGMPEDTKALSGGVLSDEAFLNQARMIFEERVRLMKGQLKAHKSGVLFVYFSSVDLVSHMFWRTFVDDRPPELEPYKDAIPEFYEKADAALGIAMKQIEGTDTTLIVMSDHGFAPFTWKVHLNNWLLDKGYLAVHEGEIPKDRLGPLGHIDWDRTQAYGIGLNQLFINRKGREKYGAVDDEEAQLILRRIKRDLLSWRHEETGQRVVTRVEAPAPGTYADRQPDLLVGYNRGYRSSDPSAQGMIASTIIEKNTSKWSGDHCMDPAHVPGVLLSNKPLAVAEASLVDMAPTLLQFYGVKPPEDMPGRSVLHAHDKPAGDTPETN